MIKLVLCTTLMISLALTAAALSDHPRLLLTKERENEIKNNLADPVAQKYFREIIISADKIIEMPPVERKLVGGADNTYTMIVSGRPAKAGIDPDNKLIDRKPDDNMTAVEMTP